MVKRFCLVISIFCLFFAFNLNFSFSNNQINIGVKPFQLSGIKHENADLDVYDYLESITNHLVTGLSQGDCIASVILENDDLSKYDYIIEGVVYKYKKGSAFVRTIFFIPGIASAGKAALVSKISVIDGETGVVLKDIPAKIRTKKPFSSLDKCLQRISKQTGKNFSEKAIRVILDHNKNREKNKNALKNKVESAVTVESTPNAESAAAVESAATVDELFKAKALYESGALTEEEFSNLKAKIINK